MHKRPYTLAIALILAASPAYARYDFLELDGINDEVDVGHVSELDFEHSDSFSVEAWFATTDDKAAIVTKSQNHAPYRGYEFKVVDGAITFYLSNDWNSGNRMVVETTASDFSDGAWHHVAVTYDGSGSTAGIKIYVDSVLQAVDDSDDNLSGTARTTESFIIGGYPGSSNARNFAGRLDEIRVWDDVRTAAEISANMDADLTGSEAGLIALYEFEDGACAADNTTTATSAADSTSNGNDGTLVGFALTGKSSNWYCEHALHLDGTDKVLAGDVHDFEYNDSFSIESWFATTDTNGAFIRKQGGHPNRRGYNLWLHDEAISFRLVSTKNAGTKYLILVRATTPGINDGAWHHVAVTYNGNGLASGVAMYVDGVAVALNVEYNTLGGRSTVNGVNFTIGGSAGGNLYNGSVDEVRVWNDVRTESEIVGNMYTEMTGSEANLQAVYDFNRGTCNADNSGETIAYDHAGTAENGTLDTFALTGTSSNWICSAH